jgi:hypothetical protein
MSLAGFRNDFERLVAAFLWRQWVQLGVSGAKEHEDAWCQDPEALLAATLELARGEPRLFDEVADWLTLNEPRLSMQRFRNALAGGAGGSVAIAAGLCAALGREVPGFRWRLSAKAPEEATQALLFDGPATGWSGAGDEAFRSVGLVRGPLRLSSGSRQPVLTTPVSFAFRLRELLGVTVRAEVVRVLLLHPDRELGTAQVAAACLYAKRNVAQGLASLAAAGVVTQGAQGRADRWQIDRARWFSFLGLAGRERPTWVDWPSLLRGLLSLGRWLRSRNWEQVSPYLQASEAREITGRVAAQLQAALPGWKPPDARRHGGDEYLGEFTASMGPVLRFMAGGAGGARTAPGKPGTREGNEDR